MTKNQKMGTKHLPQQIGTPAHHEGERIERFQALQSGQYWRALKKIPQQGIQKDEVLLIQSIRVVDDKPHTIILRPHPKNIGQSFETRSSEGGKSYTRWVAYDEHRFLLDDFLQSFEFEPDHQRIRSQEIAQVQSKVSQLQTELLETQTNPQLMAIAVEESLKEIEKEASRNEGGRKRKDENAAPANMPVAAEARLIQAATGSIVGAIGAGLNESDISQIKATAQRQHQIATAKAKWITNKTEEIAETIQAMTPFYEEQAAAALAQTEDVRIYVDKLVKGIESLDLYVGKGVEVEHVRSGEDAPADEPLTFMQRKLLMDEELAVYADVDDKFDFGNEDGFFEELRKNDALLNQIFPTPRCVLVMAVTRRDVEYSDLWTSVQRNKENKKVFLLVRNGGNVHRVFSPVESHLGAARLFPTKDDQERIFRGMDGTEIKFDDVAFTDKLAEHELHALHFKRFLLLACGLDHRLKLFGEFYPGPPSMKFVSLEFQDQYCRFLHDDPRSGNLLGSKDRVPVAKWVAEKNRFLRSGSRVLCHWGVLMNPSTAPGACKETNYSRRGFRTQYHPKNKFDVLVAYREGKSLCVDIEVFGELQRSTRERSFTCKVNLTAFKDGEWEYTDMPFLCLDAVEPEELRYYIHNRDSRLNHLDYIRFFKRALKHVEAEYSEQQSSRTAMRAALKEGRLATGDQAEALISQAIVAWRAANRGRPLPVFDGSASPEWESVLNQMYMLAGSGQNQVAETETFVRSLGYEPLRLVLSGGAKLLIYAQPTLVERDDRLIPHAWVHCITIEQGKRGLKEKSRRWALLPTHAASESCIHEWPLAQEWAGRTGPFSSFEAKQKILARTDHFTQDIAPFLSPMDDQQCKSHFQLWSRVRADYLRNSKTVRNPRIGFPIGVVYYPGLQELRYICLASSQPHAILYRRSYSPKFKEQLKASFVSVYNDKQHATEKFENDLTRSDWKLIEVRVNCVPGHDGYQKVDCERRPLDGEDSCDPRLSSWLDAFRAGLREGSTVWFNPSVIRDGECVLDPMVGTLLPKDFEPVVCHYIELRKNDKNAKLPKYTRWYDITKRGKGMTRRGYFEFSDEEPVDVPEGCGYSQYGSQHASRQDARDKITSSVKAGRAVSSNELPDAPQPPAEVERWYIVSAD